MAEEDRDEENTEATEAPAKKGHKILFIVGGVILLLVAVGTPLVFMMIGGEEQPSEAQLSEDAATPKEDLVIEGFEDEDELDEGEEAIGAIFPLESFVVNLNEGGYLRCQVQLEFATRDVPKRFYLRLVPVRDTLLDLLSSKTRKELLERKGREQLKDEVKERVNEVLRRADVDKVYFSQFLVQ